jgi:hypothetical protein
LARTVEESPVVVATPGAAVVVGPAAVGVGECAEEGSGAEQAARAAAIRRVREEIKFVGTCSVGEDGSLLGWKLGVARSTREWVALRRDWCTAVSPRESG